MDDVAKRNEGKQDCNVSTEIARFGLQGKFRKKPVIIEAVQHLGPEPLPIVTLEGTMLAQPGDWIITGVKGERYPCKPDIFAATYEPVEDTTELVIEEQATQVKPWQGSWPRPFGYSLKEWHNLDEQGRGLVWFMRMRAGSMSGDGRMTMADVDLELREHVAKQMEKVKAFVHFGAYISQTDCARQLSDYPGLKVERQDWTKVTCPECKA